MNLHVVIETIVCVEICIYACLQLFLLCYEICIYSPMSYTPLIDNEGRVQVGLYVSLGDFVLSGLRNVPAERTVFEIGTSQPFDL